MHCALVTALVLASLLPSACATALRIKHGGCKARRSRNDPVSNLDAFSDNGGCASIASFTNNPNGGYEIHGIPNGMTLQLAQRSADDGSICGITFAQFKADGCYDIDNKGDVTVRLCANGWHCGLTDDPSNPSYITRDTYDPPSGCVQSSFKELPDNNSQGCGRTSAICMDCV